jgi:ribosomal protein L37E
MKESMKMTTIPTKKMTAKVCLNVCDHCGFAHMKRMTIKEFAHDKSTNYTSNKKWSIATTKETEGYICSKCGWTRGTK